ncbi:dTDP-glucose 4,6-dehydratase [Alphaproteobacteria bacterium]|nr:dTDP-glucose 4,6-dehydratase [Alphaproteobacteria bacterium]
MKLLITGGAGFIGINLINNLVKLKLNIIVVDKLTYASNKKEIFKLTKNKNIYLEKVDITSKKIISELINKHKPDKILNLAAESHVDNSIKKSNDFIKTNIIGTFNLLECSLDYYKQLSSKLKKTFVFYHISTDEVYGDLKKKDKPFVETSRYLPSSPYSATKASSDHLVRAWGRTYNLPYLISNCGNNFGPFQNNEKLIPTIISKIINNKKIPIYGKGDQIRDWIYVDDHVSAIKKILFSKIRNETFNIGAGNELKNIIIAKKICSYLDIKSSKKNKKINKSSELINYVSDRPGHDYRYAINSNKIRNKLKWKPKISFDEGLKKTINWYLDNL